MNLPTQLSPVPDADGLYLWAPEGTGLWGYANCLWIISGSDAAVIDTPYDGPLTEAMIAAARPWLGDRTVRTVVNTHANGDHSFGNHLFPEAEIIATNGGHDHQHHEPTRRRCTPWSTTRRPTFRWAGTCAITSASSTSRRPDSPCPPRPSPGSTRSASATRRWSCTRWDPRTTSATSWPASGTSSAPATSSSTATTRRTGRDRCRTSSTPASWS
ncbi:MBL fold metallo-hydrolase [Streptomyces kanamyceticus]|uniref:MBL fold metallo-hydrolase n=1 Tax=Streptomyces kanamyceticus TaxID=1967 RepID=A0A5J6GN96_STRKN|nr:MBL fold metallo-hydrolase [Streptomyces kanamyceticus]